jgi:hypothetical protein
MRDYDKDKTPSITARLQHGGAVEAGNIDLHSRPKVRNPDGSYSTVRSRSFSFGNEHVLLPTVHPEGRIMNDDEAVDRYKTTGEHLGKFRSQQDADDYAKQLHEEQEQEYGD